MAGKKRTPDPPDWYRPDRYVLANDLDAGDWLLNLTLRQWLHRGGSPRTEEALREVGPIIRRKDGAQIKLMHLADAHRWVYSFDWEEWEDPMKAFEEACERPSLPADVWHALRTGTVKSGIEPLTVSAFYLFEKMLPEEVRTRGASFQSGDRSRGGPPAFGGRLDHAFSRQMVNRFVRIDLALPDDVLRADFDEFLASERKSLADIGGEQPYREAAHLKLKVHELRTLANVGLLQFLDLDRWQSTSGFDLSEYAVREMAGVADRSREVELRQRVKLSRNQFQLHAWFARLHRGGGRARKS